MAKKQSLSYGPNLGLIGGARDVAQSKALMQSAGGTAFVESMTNTIQTGIKEEEKRKSVLDAFMTDLGSIQNINILDQDYNKQQVTDFVRGRRAEYAKLADAYHKTKDTNILDKMDAIKFSFNNLNQQLQGLVNERKDYLTAHEKGQLIGLPGDGIYVDMYTNKSKFSIGDNGDIGFSNNGVYSKFKDVAGKWNVNNNIYKNAFLKLDGGVVARASKGGKFDKVGITNQISSLLSSQGVEEAQVAFKTDVVGDENMIIGKDKDGNNILAGNLSFESIWSKGGMDPEFYRGYNKNADGSYDTKWMFENKNPAEGIRLKAMYDAKVLEQRHNDNFIFKENRVSGKQANFIIGGQTFSARDFNNSFVPFINKLAKPSEGETFVSPTGMKFKFQKGNYYVYDVNDKTIDKDKPMTFNDVAVADGWANFFNFNNQKFGEGLDKYYRGSQMQEDFGETREVSDVFENKSNKNYYDLIDKK
tara:strand:+ start:2506 stop:3927 length:1422 start_codon:yes stop_codon:yes gene_type:complete